MKKHFGKEKLVANLWPVLRMRFSDKKHNVFGIGHAFLTK